MEEQRTEPTNSKKKPKSWRKYSFEFLSIFIAVVSAFALENWRVQNQENESETKILREIANGLMADLADTKLNMKGHKDGLRSIAYLDSLVSGLPANPDSLHFHFHYAFRDFVSIQNVAGYETLKSKGLELIENDELRLQIISLYEYNYNTLRKLEEEYNEMQFHKNYFKDINSTLSPFFIFDENLNISNYRKINLSQDEVNLIKSYLAKIKRNREFILRYYKAIEVEIMEVHEKIIKELE